MRLTPSPFSLLDNLSPNTRGAAWMLIATVLFGLMTACIGAVKENIHAFEISAWRTGFGFLIMLPFVARSGFGLLRTRRHGMLITRGVCSAFVQNATFLSLALLPMADAIALSFTAPLFGTLLAILFLGEVLRVRRSIAMIVGFAGVLIVLRPGFAEIGWAHATPLISAISMATSWIIVRSLGRTEPTERILFYMNLYLIPTTFVPAIFFWTDPSWAEIGWMFGVAVAANLFQVALTNAYKGVEATAIMPFDFARLPFVALAAFIVLGQRPDVWTWVGGAVIFAATVYIARREALIARNQQSREEEILKDQAG